MKKERKISQGDVFYVKLDDAIGHEQNGNGRPSVVVLQNNIGNKYSPTTIIVPLTTKEKNPLPQHYDLKMEDYPFLKYESTVLCEQVRCVDIAMRLDRKIGSLNQEDLVNICNLVQFNFNTISD